MADKDLELKDKDAEKAAKKAKKKKKPKKGKPQEEETDVKAGEEGLEEEEKKPPKEKKPHPILKTAAAACGLWLFGLLFFTFCAYLDLFSVKQGVLQFLSPDMSYEDLYAGDIEAVRSEELSLQMRALSLDEVELGLSEREGQLDEWESELDTREQELAEKYPWADEESAQEDWEPIDISVVVKTVESMDAARAAEAFTILTNKELGARILSQCKPARSAAILSAMTGEEAAAYLELMGGEPS